MPLASNHSQQLVQKLWNYCNILRDDGLSYGDYIEQLTYLLFLKMAHEQTLPPYNRASPVPTQYAWPSLIAKDGDDLEVHYRHILEGLGSGDGMLSAIFRRAQNKITTPALLRRLVVDLIDKQEWSTLGVDVKGDAYEGLLEKNAQDIKTGAGQYFTPRPLIQAMVKCVRPKPGETVSDPACGTGGFLLAAYDFIMNNYELDRGQKNELRLKSLRGTDLVDGVVRLCLMNLLLHGIGPNVTETDVPLPIERADSLAKDPDDRFDVVLTNPPFGRKSSMQTVTDEGDVSRQDMTIVREDFRASTSNKQLNFLQHIRTILKQHGRAAVVVPDNVLFEGGAGEVIRRWLLDECDLHTLLRLPTGIFYAQGVKANVLFFDRRPASDRQGSGGLAATRHLWVYDLRTNKHFTLKTNPLKRADLDEFVTLYNPTNRHDRTPTWSEDNPDGRWRHYNYDELIARDKVNLDLFWLRDESLDDGAALADPDAIALEIVEDLRAALEEFEQLYADLSTEPTAVGSFRPLDR